VRGQVSGQRDALAGGLQRWCRERWGDARGLIEYLNVAGKISGASENDVVGSAVHPHIPVSFKDTGLCVDLRIGAVRRIDI
jgi:hypothetical protein